MVNANGSRLTRGVALLLVLWCTAALAVMVTGMVAAQRAEARLAIAARSQLEAAALGQAAILQVVQLIAGNPTPFDRLHRRTVDFEGHQTAVDVLPLNGLIDIANAPQSLLADLLIYAGGLAAPAAGQLAAEVEARRRRIGPEGRAVGLETPEELLAVAGFDVDLLSRIASLVTVGSAGGGKVNPLCAPDGVLLVLARGNSEVAARIAASRDAGDPAVDTTMLQAGHIDGSIGSRYRFSARVLRPDGGVQVVSRDIDVRMPLVGGSPWRTLGASIHFEVARARSQ